MKLFKNIAIFAFVACFASLFAVACSDDDGIDNRELDYGYVQFKLYKEGLVPETPSTELQTRANGSTIVDELEYLSDARKIEIQMLAGGNVTITQTLTLNYADKESAEFGLRSDKLQLLTGEYQIVSYTLYDVLDNQLYIGTTQNNKFSVVAGGLTVHDLTAKVTPRGKVQFNLLKDMKNFDGSLDYDPAPTRAADRQREYTFDEIGYFDVTVHEVGTDKDNITFSYLQAEFSVHFGEDGIENIPSEDFGYQTSSITCDSLLSLPAGTYEIVGYATYDSNKVLLEECHDTLAGSEFTVADNQTTEADVPIQLYQADEYMKDNYALKAIWEALDGPNWYYGGQDYNKGCNWDFNKSPDLWSAQPGVEVHSNGRVAKIVLSEFGISGHMPAAIGQLTELVELYLGTHNDTNTGTYDPMLDPSKSLEDRNRNRLEYNKQYLAATHIQPQMSYPCALALKEHNLSSPAMALYEQGYTEEQIFDKKTGKQREIQPKDVIAGRFCNNLLSLPNDIGRLSKLEYLYIGNSPIEMLPDSICHLKSCTLLEIYNCPNMHGLPQTVKEMPALVQVNISCNSGTKTVPGWTDEELRTAIINLATGASKNTIQMLYARDNNLESIPTKEIAGMEYLGLLDLANNKISGAVEAFGNNFMPAQLYFDNNQITEFKTVEIEGGRRIFCNTDNLETFSASYNQLTEVPDIFTSNTPYYLSSATFAYNKITRFQNADNGTYQGINVTTFTLSGNQIKEYPACMAKSNSQISYIILAGNGMESFEEGCFTSPKPETMANLISIDFTYNRLTQLPKEFHAGNMPYLYGVDLSYNAFNAFPWGPTDALSLTVLGVRGQRDNNGGRCLREWPTGIYQHTGLRGLFLGSNDLRKIDDTISYLIYNLDISDNPNITFDASDICYYWQAGAFNLIYDKTQNITNCADMLE